MFDIPATSAFVLQFTRESAYASASARKFLASVDLTSGEALKNAFEVEWDVVYEEVANRKFGVQMQCREFLSAMPDAQVILLGGGLDPLSIDLAGSFPSSTVFDVDLANMDVKQQINASIQGPSVRFCTANLADADSLAQVLRQRGWDVEKPTLLVAEGITYYVPKHVFQ